jgi:hypothetical protein
MTTKPNGLTASQLHLPVGAEIVLGDFQRSLADETMNRIIVGDRELRNVPRLVEMKENKNTSFTRKHVQREAITGY